MSASKARAAGMCDNCWEASGPCEGSITIIGELVPCVSTRSKPTSPIVAVTYHSFACTEYRRDGSCCKSRPAFKPVDQRPGWPAVWMRTALEVARQSTCPRGSGCGAIFTTANHELIVTGVNGSPRKAAHCYDVGCLLVEGHCRRTIHAEINGIIQATLSSRTLAGSYLYITYPPCINCALALVQAEVKQIAYFKLYESGAIHTVALDILHEGKVRIQRFQEAV